MKNTIDVREEILKTLKMGDYVTIKHNRKGEYTIRFAAVGYQDGSGSSLEGYVTGWVTDYLRTPLITWYPGDIIYTKIDNIVEMRTAGTIVT